MKVIFIKARRGYGFFAGDTANLPDEIAKQFIEEGFVKASEDAGTIKSDLPEDLPVRQVLIDSGLVNKADVLAAAETLTDIKGVGKKTAEDILTQLKG